MSDQSNTQHGSLTRRTLMTGTLSAATALPLASAMSAPVAADGNPKPRGGRDTMNVTMQINGQSYQFDIDVRTSLLDLLRDHAGLTGTKKGCDHGQCGACTVLTDGRRTLSCMSFAVMNDTAEITTIEGLASDEGELHPMQQAFIDHDAFQCGYCTPGQILSAVGCVNENHAGSDAEIREYMSGNLCRCAAYPNIVAAVKQGRDAMRKA